jgi:hypothetical protein
MEELKEMIEESKQSAEKEINEQSQLLKTEMINKIDAQEYLIESIKEEITLTHRRLAHERHDHEVSLTDIKNTVEDSLALLTKHFSEIKYLKGWSLQLNEVLGL